MSLIKGAATFTRFRAEKAAPSVTEVRDALVKYAFQPIVSGESSSSGWVSALDILDTKLNTLDFGEWLLFARRTDTINVPSSLVAIELKKAIAKELQDSGANFLSRARKRELKEQVEMRLRSKALAVPSMKMAAWNMKTNEVLYEGTSEKQVDAFKEDFRATFGFGLSQFTPMDEATRQGKEPPLENSDYGAGSVDAKTPDEVISRDFLMYLWAREALDGPAVEANGKPYILFVDRNLSLCNNNGSLSISGDEEEHFDEARRAIIQSGRILSRAGFTVQCGDAEWKLSLKSGSVIPSGIKKPKYKLEEGDDPDGVILLELEGIQEMLNLFDALYAQFLELRVSAKWDELVKKIAEWSKR